MFAAADIALFNEKNICYSSGFRKLGKMLQSIAELQHTQASVEVAILGDFFTYYAINARVVKVRILIVTSFGGELQVLTCSCTRFVACMLIVISLQETLSNRIRITTEYETAKKNTISKRRYIERLKASTSIKPERVDEALEDLEYV